MLETNGRASSGKRTRHINIRYFFVHNRVDAGEVSIQYCPTGDMLADYFTKPLQGSKFQQFRNLIMNVNPPTASRSQDCRSVLGESDTRDTDAMGPDVALGKDDEWTVVRKRQDHRTRLLGDEPRKGRIIGRE